MHEDYLNDEMSLKIEKLLDRIYMYKEKHGKEGILKIEAQIFDFLEGIYPAKNLTEEQLDAILNNALRICGTSMSLLQT